ncbi:hypothetical protein ABPG72_008189 [Tetrahymena utriculariae]
MFIQDIEIYTAEIVNQSKQSYQTMKTMIQNEKELNKIANIIESKEDVAFLLAKTYVQMWEAVQSKAGKTESLIQNIQIYLNEKYKGAKVSRIFDLKYNRFFFQQLQYQLRKDNNYYQKLLKFSKKTTSQQAKINSQPTNLKKEMQQRIEEIAKNTQGCSIDKQRMFMFFQELRKQQKHYNDFEYLGNGSFAFVIKAFNKNSQKQVALKVVVCNQNEPNDAEFVLNEYNLLLKVKHCPYLVDVYNQFYIYEDQIILQDSDEEDQIGDKPKKEK